MNNSLLSDPVIAALKPIVIRSTRFSGEVEGWEFVALPNCWATSAAEYPGAFERSRDVVREWWQDPANLKAVGVGMTPNDALGNLLGKLHPGEVLAEEELFEIDESALIAEMQEARKDSFSLLTAYMNAIDSGKFDDSNDLSCEIVDEWEDPSALVACLVGLAARFLHEMAIREDLHPLAKLQQIALAFEENSG